MDMKKSIAWHLEQYNESGSLGHLIIAGKLAEAEHERGTSYDYEVYGLECYKFQIHPIDRRTWLENQYS